MNRLKELVRFIEFDSKNNIIVEPGYRINFIKEKLFEVISTYNPKIILKAGLGNHELLNDIASKVDSYLIVIEPSRENIQNFLKNYGSKEKVREIKFIQGDFENLPIDYYTIDLLIFIDYFDFTFSGRVIDEFRLAVNFDHFLFLGGVILNENDIDGVWDDFMKTIFPLHNDFYLSNDLETFLDLNDFNMIKSQISSFNIIKEDIISYFREIFGNGDIDPHKFIESNNSALKEFYAMNDETFTIPYYIGTYRRKRLEAEDAK